MKYTVYKFGGTSVGRAARYKAFLPIISDGGPMLLSAHTHLITLQPLGAYEVVMASGYYMHQKAPTY